MGRRFPRLFLSSKVFVETLDKCFENVCELDIIFHGDKVHYILDEIIMGGMVLETNVGDIVRAVNDMMKVSMRFGAHGIAGSQGVGIRRREKTAGCIAWTSQSRITMDGLASRVGSCSCSGNDWLAD